MLNETPWLIDPMAFLFQIKGPAFFQARFRFASHELNHHLLEILPLV